MVKEFRVGIQPNSDTVPTISTEVFSHLCGGLAKRTIHRHSHIQLTDSSRLGEQNRASAQKFTRPERTNFTVEEEQLPVLEITDLSISFFTHEVAIPAVKAFSMRVMPGETVGLVGESGSGKSTVALAIMRYLGRNGRITQGSVKFLGEDLVKASDASLRTIRGKQISMVYQEPSSSLNSSMRIGDQLCEVPVVHEGVSWTVAQDRAREMLDAVGLPDPDRLMKSYAHQISGGQQQRVVIAMALLAQPKLLLMDEPTTALDVTVEAGIVDLIKDLSRRFNVSILFISHNLGLVRKTCDRTVVMYSGEAVEEGPASVIFGAPRHPYSRGLLQSLPVPDADKTARRLRTIPGQLPLPHERPQGCNFGPRCECFVAGQCDVAEITMQDVPGDGQHLSRCVRLAEIDWNATGESIPLVAELKIGGTVIEVDKLQKYYTRPRGILSGGGEVVKANETVSFNARAGETVALVGESGCGKSTLAKVLMGLEPATGGEVRLNGVDIGRTEVRRRDRDVVRGMQMIFQNPFDTLNPSRKVGTQLLRVLKTFGVGRNRTERVERMNEIFDSVKLPRDFASRLPRQLSGGQKQRVAIARAFAGSPKVVVADEPVSALDASVQAAVTDLLMQIQAENGTTMLFISHDLGLVRYLADWVVVMYLGHVVEQGRTDDVFAPPYHPYTEALLSAVPIADARVQQKRIVLSGDVPSAQNPPPGCPFQTRCPRKTEAHSAAGHAICETIVPPIIAMNGGHAIKCHLPQASFDAMEPVIALRSETVQHGVVAGF